MQKRFLLMGWGSVLITILFAPVIFAEQRCPAVEATMSDGTQLRFMEYQFPDGGHDLVLVKASSANEILARVTYKANKVEACEYQALNLLAGGTWGWHFFWARKDSPGLYYARMDGEAWVSSPPRRLIKDEVADFKVVAEGEILRVEWQGAASSSHWDTRISHDEGRSWD